jgi:hypothetical protein
MPSCGGRKISTSGCSASLRAAWLAGLVCRGGHVIGRFGSRDIIERYEKPRAARIEPPGKRTVVGLALWQAQQNVN